MLSFQVMALLAPVLGMVAPLGEAPLVVICGAVVVIMTLISGRRPSLPGNYLILFWALIGLSFLSCLWTIDLSLTASRAVRLVAEVVIGFALVDAAGQIDEAARRRLMITLTIGLALAVVIIVVDDLSDHAFVAWLRPLRPLPTEFDRGSTTLVVFAWPVLIYLGRRRAWWPAIGLLLLIAMVVGSLLSDSAKLALISGVAVAALVFFGGKLVAKPLSYLLPLGILMMPLLALSLPPPEALIHDRPIAKVSALHRLVIWQFTGQRIRDRPISGWGLETSRDLPGGDQRYAIEGRPDAPPMVALSLHPHNGALQIWVELGVAGALLGSTLLYLLAREGAGLQGIGQAGFYGATISALMIAMLSYGVWQSWWDEELWLFAALMRMVLSGDAARRDQF
jgi:exopolysaccharide production protein ExoQ